MSSSEAVAGLYLHAPFCASRCAYCDFATEATCAGDPLIARYVAVLERCVGELSEAGLLSGLASAYVGGGTPSLLGEGLIGLIECVASHAPSVTEVSFEANPESLGRALVRAAREVGATRVSVGVQVLDDELLAGLGRVHGAQRALDAIDEVRAAGLACSVDLMVGIPGLDLALLDDEIAEVVGRGVGHVSVYALELHEGTPLAAKVRAGEVALPDEDAVAEALERAAAELDRLGLARYEVSNFAAPGARCTHNLTYWQGRPYLGLGPSAASMLDRALYERLRDVAPRLPSLPAEVSRVRLTMVSPTRAVAAASGLGGLAFEIEGLDAAQAAAEDLMLAARLADGLSPELVARARAILGEDVDRTLEALSAQGLIQEGDGGCLGPSARGFLMGNVVFGDLWDLAPRTSTFHAVSEGIGVDIQ